MKINGVKGFRDVLPGESEVWAGLETAARRVFERYGFGEIRIPLMERTELFARAAGETSDIVEKQMYTFTDVDGASVTLRPEGTASVVRAYVENGVHGREPVSKLYYMGPMFRRERPQKGRYRQFHQIGAEVLGRDDPLADAELLVLLDDYFADVGLTRYRIEINSLGCSRCRPVYREELRRWAQDRRASLCDDCNRRIEQNPLRVLDCKQDADETVDAPVMLDRLCSECRTHFDRVRALLASEGVGVSIKPRMVRGLDYYCRTAFEIVAEGLGSQNAIGGGGRYDGLVADLGGPSVAAAGFAIGIERLAMALRPAEIKITPDLVIAPLGAAAETEGLRVARNLRRAGLRVEVEPGQKSLKSHMRRADKLGAAFVLILGEDELSRAVGVLRDLAAHEQSEIALDTERIAARLRAGAAPSPRDDV